MAVSLAPFPGHVPSCSVRLLCPGPRSIADVPPVAGNSRSSAYYSGTGQLFSIPTNSTFINFGALGLMHIFPPRKLPPKLSADFTVYFWMTFLRVGRVGARVFLPPPPRPPPGKLEDMSWINCDRGMVMIPKPSDLGRWSSLDTKPLQDRRSRMVESSHQVVPAAHTSRHFAQR